MKAARLDDAAFGAREPMIDDERVLIDLTSDCLHLPYLEARDDAVQDVALDARSCPP